MKNSFIINDIDDFVDKTRTMVYVNFGSWEDDKTDIDYLIDNMTIEESDDLDKILSHKEALTIVKDIVKKQRHKHLKTIRYVLDENLFIDVIEALNDRMVSNILHSLVQKGLVEHGFDEETNDFIFWIKDDEKESPETD